MFEKCTIKVLDACGSWYDNCVVENDFDAFSIAKFYKYCMGYSVQIWKGETDITNLIDSMNTIMLKKD